METQPKEKSTSDAVQPRLEYLTPEQRRRIISGAIEVLEKFGMQVDNEEATQLLIGKGARVSDEGLILIPEELLEQCLDTAPSQITLKSRGSSEELAIGPGLGTFFGSGSCTPFTVDLETGKRRQSGQQDVLNFALLIEALENINFCMSMGLSRGSRPYLENLVAMIMGTTKPIIFDAQDAGDVEDIYRIARTIPNGTESIVLMVGAQTPRLFPGKICGQIMKAAEFDIPQVVYASVNTGGQGPILVPAGAVLATAESLFGLVLSQLTNPGAPFVFGWCQSDFEMSTSTITYGTPGWPTGSTIMAEIARDLNLPSWGTAGATDSCQVDAQAGIEAFNSILMSLLAGNNLVHDMGFTESGTTSNPGMLVLADMIVSLARYPYQIQLTDQTLLLEAIGRVEPGGTFLTDPSTYDYLRDPRGQWRNPLMNRSQFSDWLQEGGTTLGERCLEKARRLLRASERINLPPATVTLINKLGIQIP